jgi:hypothetical protein
MTLPLSPPLLSIACTHGDHRECIREYVLGDIEVVEVDLDDLDLYCLVLWNGSRGTVHCDCSCHGGA